MSTFGINHKKGAPTRLRTSINYQSLLLQNFSESYLANLDDKSTFWYYRIVNEQRFQQWDIANYLPRNRTQSSYTFRPTPFVLVTRTGIEPVSRG